MTKQAKNLILISSFAAFFIFSGLIVFYAYGYQFDFKNLKLVKTGGILIRANTDGAEVFIDGQFEGKTSFLTGTFAKKNLLPGDYEIEVKKEGLPALKKSVEVKSGEVSQLVHLYLAGKKELLEFVENPEPAEEVKEYFISKIDGLLYRRFEKEKVEKVSSESVYIKDYKLKVLQANIYLASRDADAPGVFSLLSSGSWEQIYQLPSNDLVLSPDNKKLAIVGPNEITVLWLKDENEPPYFKKGHEELVLKIGEKIKEALWFETGWHLVYTTELGETKFIELDPTGGRVDVKI